MPRLQISFWSHYNFIVDTVKGCYESDPKNMQWGCYPCYTGVFPTLEKRMKKFWPDVCIKNIDITFSINSVFLFIGLSIIFIRFRLNDGINCFRRCLPGFPFNRGCLRKPCPVISSPRVWQSRYVMFTLWWFKPLFYWVRTSIVGKTKRHLQKI